MGTEIRTVTVGQAARQAGVSEKAVRLYESRGVGFNNYVVLDVSGR